MANLFYHILIRWGLVFLLLVSVVDTNTFNADPDPAFHLDAYPDPGSFEKKN